MSSFDEHSSLLKCSFQNVRSICNKLDFLHALLSVNAYDVLYFNETWLDKSITNNLTINNSHYSMVRHDRDGKTGGGILALVKKCIIVSVIDLCQFTVSEIIAFDILYSKVICRLIFAYRPPNGDSVDLDYLQDKITSLCMSHIPCIVMGDFNLLNRRWKDFIQSTNKMHISFANMLQLNSLHQYITRPTRNDNKIDLVCCNDSSIAVDCTSVD